MKITDEQYEKIARRLDGENVELSFEEQKLADEIRLQGSLLGGKLASEVPSRAISRAKEKIRAVLGARGKRTIRTMWFASAAAVAAVIAVAVLIYKPTSQPDDQSGTTLAESVPTETVIEYISSESLTNGQFSAFDKELVSFKEAISEVFDAENEFTDLDEELESFWFGPSHASQEG